MEGSSIWGQDNLKFKARPVSYLRQKSMRMKWQIPLKVQKEDSVTKYSQGMEGINSNRIMIILMYSQQTSPAWNQKVFQTGKQM